MNTRLTRLRRPLAALFAAAAAGLALLALRPGAPPSARVLAAARDLPAGTALGPSDLRPVALPPASVPAGALRTGAVGRVIAGPMRQGEPLTDVRVIGDALLRGYGPGKVATPVRIADPDAVRLLHPGDRIDVLTTPTGEPEPPEEARGPTGDRPFQGAADAPGNAQESSPRPRQVQPALGRPPAWRPFTTKTRATTEPNWNDARVVASDVPIVAIPPKPEDTAQDGALIVLATDRPQALALAAAGPHLSLTITGP
ncbi:SAF domain-containing protein [Actinomadura formosensis]|uniref:SAF domain-containing protein n=1 Tax=Actinomadura formosensis TaxID=60706 RepID=UPI003D8A4A7F